ncbi:hypothetical protein [Halomonas caseinilytica]|uniref:hypothetical protein n=1 Tax=Halomonas caseinilytica TaxID=438744 RepID=UPI0008495939|nr:hypothetical protein [Halomonas caseinilytica]
MGRKAQVRVTKPNLYRKDRRCAVGDTFEVTLNNRGEVPMLYRGKVEIVDKPAMHVATPNAKANETGNQGNGDTGAEADEQRRQWLLNQIEELTGKRPGANSKLETLKAKFEQAKLTAEE